MEIPSEGSEIHWTMPRTGLSLPSLPDARDISTYLISKVLTADDVKPARALLHRVTGQGQFAEILYIIRPVIYALAMQRWKANKRSWSPWLIGFGLEYGSRQLAKKDFKERLAGGLRGLTGLEREELRKRAWAMSWWLMRGAFYENITKYDFFSLHIVCRPDIIPRAWIKGITYRLKAIPVLDLVGSLVEDYEYLWDNYYFSTATL
jgi:peroxin-16